MTLDETIERFNHNAEYERTHGNLQGCLEFRQLAEWLGELKKLKKQTEPCEDCISRQAVLECLDWYEHDRCEIDIYIREIVEDIKKLPSVQPEQRTGTWKIVDVLHGEWEGTKKYACDKCGEKVGVFKSNYCPNCGRRMGEGE